MKNTITVKDELELVQTAARARIAELERTDAQRVASHADMDIITLYKMMVILTQKAEYEISERLRGMVGT